MYDYLIVGAGLFGSVCARELTDKGYKCLVIDKRDHIGGNCYTENIEGINVHKYGPHIFHTSDLKVWNYVKRFAEFNHFTYRPRVSFEGNIYSFPINLMTMYQMFGSKTPLVASIVLEGMKVKTEYPNSNLEDWILSQVGSKLYETFIKGYTTKQWGRDPRDLPASIIKRIPIRLTYDDNYFDDIYQGIPIGGYTYMFEKMLDGIEVKLNHDFFKDRCFDTPYGNLIYTGSVDSYFNYIYGELDYRSLRFETEVVNMKDYQGVAAINYTDVNIPYTRIVEHKHFEFGQQPKTVITREYPSSTGEPYYPIRDDNNATKYEKYKKRMELEKNVIFGGRLASYRYYDMHQVIASALHQTSLIKNKNG